MTKQLCAENSQAKTRRCELRSNRQRISPSRRCFIQMACARAAVVLLFLGVVCVLAVPPSSVGIGCTDLQVNHQCDQDQQICINSPAVVSNNKSDTLSLEVRAFARGPLMLALM